VPRLVRRWKLNPTIASGPVTLALADLAALAFYFGLSSLVLL
jgi:Mg/Co/Ni transporter MgtE